jgi:hypothetical protein
MQPTMRTTLHLNLADDFDEKDAGTYERMEEETGEVIGASTTETEEWKKVEVNVLKTNDGWASLELTPGSHQRQSTVLADALFGSQLESICNQKSRQLWDCCLHSHVFKLVRVCLSFVRSLIVFKNSVVVRDEVYRLCILPVLQRNIIRQPLSIFP